MPNPNEPTRPGEPPRPPPFEPPRPQPPQPRPPPIEVPQRPPIEVPETPPIEVPDTPPRGRRASLVSGRNRSRQRDGRRHLAGVKPIPGRDQRPRPGRQGYGNKGSR